MVSNDWLLPTTDDVQVFLTRPQLQALAAELKYLTVHCDNTDTRAAITRVCDAADRCALPELTA